MSLRPYKPPYQVYKEGEIIEEYSYKNFLGITVDIPEQVLWSIKNNIPFSTNGEKIILKDVKWLVYKNLLIIDFTNQFSIKKLKSILDEKGYHTTFRKKDTLNQSQDNLKDDIVDPEYEDLYTKPKKEDIVENKIEKYFYIEYVRKNDEKKEYIYNPSFSILEKFLDHFKNNIHLCNEVFNEDIKNKILNTSEKLVLDKSYGELRDIEYTNSCWRYHDICCSSKIIILGGIINSPLTDSDFFHDGNEYGIYYDHKFNVTHFRNPIGHHNESFIPTINSESLKKYIDYYIDQLDHDEKIGNLKNYLYEINYQGWECKFFKSNFIENNSFEDYFLIYLEKNINIDIENDLILKEYFPDLKMIQGVLVFSSFFHSYSHNYIGLLELMDSNISLNVKGVFGKNLYFWVGIIEGSEPGFNKNGSLIVNTITKSYELDNFNFDFDLVENTPKLSTDNLSLINSNEDNYYKLEKLHELKEKGILTEDEFNNKKTEILNKI